MILSCTCTHQAQDQIHGKGKRVFNVLKTSAARCTVCKREVNVDKSKEVQK